MLESIYNNVRGREVIYHFSITIRLLISPLINLLIIEKTYSDIEQG